MVRLVEFYKLFCRETPSSSFIDERGSFIVCFGDLIAGDFAAISTSWLVCSLLST